MSLSRLIAGFVRQHWPAYAAAAVMLTGVATLTVWIPRRIGAIIDAPAAIWSELSMVKNLVHGYTQKLARYQCSHCRS